MTGHDLPVLLELGPGIEERHLVGLAVEASNKPGPYVVRLRCVVEVIDWEEQEIVEVEARHAYMVARQWLRRVVHTPYETLAKLTSALGLVDLFERLTYTIRLVSRLGATLEMHFGGPGQNHIQ